MIEERLTNIIPKGKYIRIVIRGVKFSVLKNISAKPLIVSQTNYGENTRGFLLVRFKRQKWYNALLKSNDPLIVSAGFHKF